MRRAIILGKNAAAVGEPPAKYADKVLAVDDETLENFNPELYIDIIQQILGDHKPACLLFGDTPFGKEAAPGLAVKVGAPVQTDVISVDASDGVSVSKYMSQGKVLVDMALKNQIFTF